METSVSLLERLRQPAQEDAWARFVELYTPLLHHWARRRGCQESEADDLVQEVLLLLVRKLPEFSYDRSRTFRGWLRALALNCWHNLRRRPQLSREANAPDLADLPAASDANEFWEVEYRAHLVGRALDLMRAEFQPTTWQACWRCVVDGQPGAVVAAELGISTGAVYMAKSRVLSRLRQELQGLVD